MSRRGFTLLEAMVALVILGLVVVGYLEVFSSAVRTVQHTETWTQAVSYAADGMELARLDLAGTLARGREHLSGGFARQVQMQPAGEGLRLVSVTVLFPDGGEYTLHRLFEDQ